MFRDFANASDKVLQFLAVAQCNDAFLEGNKRFICQGLAPQVKTDACYWQSNKLKPVNLFKTTNLRDKVKKENSKQTSRVTAVQSKTFGRLVQTRNYKPITLPRCLFSNLKYKTETYIDHASSTKAFSEYHLHSQLGFKPASWWPVIVSKVSCTETEEILRVFFAKMPHPPTTRHRKTSVTFLQR